MRSYDLVVQGKDSSVPDFIQDDVGPSGLEDLKNYIVPPRIKVVQPLSGTAFKERFSEGDTVLTPSMISIADIIKNENGKPTKHGESWEFVPVFFFAEFIAWNPRKLNATLPSIRERSVDPGSALASKCRNRETWFEPCPENVEESIRNTEHLNFIVVPLSGECAGTPCVMSFCRSEMKAGTAFASLAGMRKTKLYGRVFQAQVGWRENIEGEWYGIDVTNPDDEESGPYVTDEAVYNSFKKLHFEMKKAHAAQLIRPDYEEFEGDGSEVTSEM